MKTTALAATLCLLLAAVLAGGAARAADAADAVAFGTMNDDASDVTIADLLSDPDAYVGRVVRVTGTITDVCPKMGCWIDIVDDSGQRHVRFKVQDGEMVFPVESTGKPVVAEGTFTRIEMSREDAVAWARHLAEERGESFDPATDAAPTVIYRLDGRGAVIR